MNLEKLLGKDLAEQVQEKIGDKQLILNDGTYIPKQKFDDLNEDKKQIEKQLNEANTKIQELSGTNTEDLEKQIKEWKEKYETETKSLNEKISKREREYVINELTRDLKFSSNSAKKTFMEELANKKLKIENGKMLGFDDYVSSYKETDPEAFIAEKEEGKDIEFGDTHKQEPINDFSREKSILGI